MSAPEGFGDGIRKALEAADSSDVLADIRGALDKIAAASRVIVVHPDHEEAVRQIVAASPFPGLFPVTAVKECPQDQIFMVPKPDPPLGDMADTMATEEP